MTRVLVVGLDDVGLPLAVSAAEAGHHVIGVDLDPRKVAQLHARTSYVRAVTDERLADATSTGRFVARRGWDDTGRGCPTSLNVEVAVVAAPAPLHQDGADHSHVATAGRMIAQILQRGAAVVLESAHAPGTAAGLLADAIAEESGLVPSIDFHLGSASQRSDTDVPTQVWGSLPRLVSATTHEGLTVLDDFYRSVVVATVRVLVPRPAAEPADHVMAL